MLSQLVINYTIPTGAIPPSKITKNSKFFQSTDKNPPGKLFDVSSYGANVSAKDNLAAIQAAINAAAKAGHGAVVYIPPGKFYINGTLTLNGAGYSLQGAGLTLTYLIASKVAPPPKPHKPTPVPKPTPPPVPPPADLCKKLPALHGFTCHSATCSGSPHDPPHKGPNCGTKLPHPPGIHWNCTKPEYTDCPAKAAEVCLKNSSCQSFSFQDTKLARPVLFAGGITSLRTNKAWTTWVKTSKIGQNAAEWWLDEADKKVQAPPPVAVPRPPLLHICGSAKVRIEAMTFEIDANSVDTSVLITSSCKTAALPEEEEVERDSAGPSPHPARNGNSYRPPVRVDPKTLGTGLSVSFHHTFTWGGDYFFKNPIVLRGLKKGDLVDFVLHMGPINVTDSGDAVILTGFHYGGPTTISGKSGAGFVGELVRLTGGSYAQLLISGDNAYTAADWYHEGCQHTLIPAQDSAIIAVSMTKICTPDPKKGVMPIITTNNYDGFCYFESGSAAYQAFNVSGKGGSGDLVLFGMSLYTGDPNIAVSGAKVSLVAGMRSGMMVGHKLCLPSNKTVPNGGLPQCVIPDVLPAPLGTILDLVRQGHDYIRALGEYDLALHYPELF
jgi:hypothetical protein